MQNVLALIPCLSWYTIIPIVSLGPNPAFNMHLALCGQSLYVYIKKNLSVHENLNKHDLYNISHWNLIYRHLSNRFKCNCTFSLLAAFCLFDTKCWYCKEGIFVIFRLLLLSLSLSFSLFLDKTTQWRRIHLLLKRTSCLWMHWWIKRDLQIQHLHLDSMHPPHL